MNRADIQGRLERLSQSIASINTPAAERVRADLASAIYHCGRRDVSRPIIAIIGGTGTGKSTMFNRLLGEELSATNYRRTFTAGPVMATQTEPPNAFTALLHLAADSKPAKGSTDRLTYVLATSPILERISLVDTPDVDGELTEHHALADRVFRWCDSVVFLVSPEKYQMPELQPYYRLALRYGLPAIYVLNKADSAEVVDDYEQLLKRSGIASPVVYAVPRDDSTWQPESRQSFDAFKLTEVKVTSDDHGFKARISDVVSRVNDQLLHPLLEQRSRIDRVVIGLRTLIGDAVNLDVHPITHELQRRMREKSVLYLMGPQRMLDRVRSVPSMIARLPRGMWEWTRTGEFKVPGVAGSTKPESPDFRSIVVEQFQSLQSRVDDLIRNSLSTDQPANWKLPADDAGAIVDSELEQLKNWLESRWNATPRDTAILQRLLKVIPGGEAISKYSEAAPYLLAIACVAHGAVFGHLDLMILGGYSAFTWLTERLSNEVATKTRATNAAITERYDRLASKQIEAAIQWLDKLAPSRTTLGEIANRLDAAR